MSFDGNFLNNGYTPEEKEGYQVLIFTTDNMGKRDGKHQLLYHWLLVKMLWWSPQSKWQICAAIANRGYYFTPHVVRKIGGKALTDSTYTVAKQTQLTKNTSRPLFMVWKKYIRVIMVQQKTHELKI